MNPKLKIALAAVIIVGIISFMFGGKIFRSQINQTVAGTGHENHKHEVWTCPMHPQIHKDGPGQCPICGMNLVRADEVEQPAAQSTTMPDGHAAFKLSIVRQQLIGVKYGLVEKKTVFKSIRAAGRLAFDPELYTAQNEYVEARKQLERIKDSPLPDVKHSADAMVRSSKLRLKILGLSDSQIANLGFSDSSGANLLLNKPGQKAWVYAEIFEMDLPMVQANQSVEITANFLGGKTLIGKVVSVDRVINTASRTAKARILVTDPKTLLRPESYVDVVIHAPLGEQVTVPFDAVLDTGKQAWVFIGNEDGGFEPRLISIKFRADDDVAVEGGLMGGEKIVTSSNFLIDSESRLKGVQLAQSQPNANGAAKPSTPSCPNGQHWDTPMAMCMAGE
jgi:Cu(I)/Ag(I) efflux system membrane fusion protein